MRSPSFARRRRRVALSYEMEIFAVGSGREWTREHEEARGEGEGLRWRSERRRRRGGGAITVQEFARQEHYQGKMFRDCALERDVFGSLVRPPRRLPFAVSASRRLPCFTLATIRPIAFREPPRRHRRRHRLRRPLPLRPFSFNRNVMSVAPAGRRKSARAYSRISSTFL